MPVRILNSSLSSVSDSESNCNHPFLIVLATGAATGEKNENSKFRLIYLYWIALSVLNCSS